MSRQAISQATRSQSTVLHCAGSTARARKPTAQTMIMHSPEVPQLHPMAQSSPAPNPTSSSTERQAPSLTSPQSLQVSPSSCTVSLASVASRWPVPCGTPCGTPPQAVMPVAWTGTCIWAPVPQLHSPLCTPSKTGMQRNLQMRQRWRRPHSQALPVPLKRHSMIALALFSRLSESTSQRKVPLSWWLRESIWETPWETSTALLMRFLLQECARE
mmetsp:Transcript_24031/g.29082  ORF Transcript_24031/g.29082 Transcript_24031/m.29082 type:complete len:215 (+) Transcript_24031:4407-5051(+)